MHSGTAEGWPAGVTGDPVCIRETVVVRVNFTPDDVARTRFTVAPAPLVETALAMVGLRRAAHARGHVGTGSWVPEARRAFPATARPLLDLLGPRPPWPDFFDSAAPDIEQALEEVRATPWTTMRTDLSYAWADRPGRPPTWVRNLGDGDQESVDLLVRALRDLHQAVVAPRWESVRVAFHADVAKRIPVLAAGGHEDLFGTLHPRLRWRDDGLDRSGNDMVCDLRGDGLVLIPSAFWTGEPLFSVSEDERRPSSLLYSAAHNNAAHNNAAHANGHPSAGDGADRAAGDCLAALLGPTRAAVLRALSAPRGTVELAAVVGISPASASEHAKVLREVYLIETLRDGRAVRHSLTVLGRTMLGQLPNAGYRGDGFGPV
jgi:DNA-binding transcriptional ArsR family regulator